jgi:hypothetical protein
MLAVAWPLHDRHLVATLEPGGEDGAQGVGNTQHDLREAAGQHTDEVLVLRHILVDAAVVVVEASLQTQTSSTHNSVGDPDDVHVTHVTHVSYLNAPGWCHH